MSTQAIFIILGAGILAAIAVLAVQAARRSASPKCPQCDGTDVIEEARFYGCRICGQRWRIETPKRFGSQGGSDL